MEPFESSDPAKELAPFESSNPVRHEITLESRQKELDEWVKTMEPCQEIELYTGKRAEITMESRQKELDVWRKYTEKLKGTTPRKRPIAKRVCRLYSSQ